MTEEGQRAPEPGAGPLPEPALRPGWPPHRDPSAYQGPAPWPGTVPYPGSYPAPAPYPGSYPGPVPYPGSYPGPVPYPAAAPHGAMPYAGSPYPGAPLSGFAGFGRPVAAPPRDSWPPPSRVEAVPGTSFALGYLTIPPTTSGMAIGSLVAGIASLLVLLLVALFGLLGAADGWGGWVSGAFAVLATLLGAAGVGLGSVALRQIRRGRTAADRRTGRGLGIAGVSCGAAGAVCTALVFVLVLIMQMS